MPSPADCLSAGCLSSPHQPRKVLHRNTPPQQRQRQDFTNSLQSEVFSSPASPDGGARRKQLRAQLEEGDYGLEPSYEDPGLDPGVADDDHSDGEAAAADQALRSPALSLAEAEVSELRERLARKDEEISELRSQMVVDSAGLKQMVAELAGSIITSGREARMPPLPVAAAAAPPAPAPAPACAPERVVPAPSPP